MLAQKRDRKKRARSLLFSNNTNSDIYDEKKTAATPRKYTNETTTRIRSEVCGVNAHCPIVRNFFLLVSAVFAWMLAPNGDVIGVSASFVMSGLNMTAKRRRAAQAIGHTTNMTKTKTHTLIGDGNNSSGEPAMAAPGVCPLDYVILKTSNGNSVINATEKVPPPIEIVYKGGSFVEFNVRPDSEFFALSAASSDNQPLPSPRALFAAFPTDEYGSERCHHVPDKTNSNETTTALKARCSDRGSFSLVRVYAEFDYDDSNNTNGDGADDDDDDDDDDRPKTPACCSNSNYQNHSSPSSKAIVFMFKLICLPACINDPLIVTKQPSLSAAPKTATKDSFIDTNHEQQRFRREDRVSGGIGMYKKVASNKVGLPSFADDALFTNGFFSKVGMVDGLTEKASSKNGLSPSWSSEPGTALDLRERLRFTNALDDFFVAKTNAVARIETTPEVNSVAVFAVDDTAAAATKNNAAAAKRRRCLGGSVSKYSCPDEDTVGEPAKKVAGSGNGVVIHVAAKTPGSSKRRVSCADELIHFFRDNKSPVVGKATFEHAFHGGNAQKKATVSSNRIAISSGIESKDAIGFSADNNIPVVNKVTFENGFHGGNAEKKVAVSNGVESKDAIEFSPDNKFPVVGNTAAGGSSAGGVLSSTAKGFADAVTNAEERTARLAQQALQQAARAAVVEKRATKLSVQAEENAATLYTILSGDEGKIDFADEFHAAVARDTQATYAVSLAVWAKTHADRAMKYAGQASAEKSRAANKYAEMKELFATATAPPPTTTMTVAQAAFNGVVGNANRANAAARRASASAGRAAALSKSNPGASAENAAAFAKLKRHQRCLTNSPSMNNNCATSIISATAATADNAAAGTAAGDATVESGSGALNDISDAVDFLAADSDVEDWNDATGFNIDTVSSIVDSELENWGDEPSNLDLQAMYQDSVYRSDSVAGVANGIDDLSDGSSSSAAVEVTVTDAAADGDGIAGSRNNAVAETENAPIVPRNNPAGDAADVADQAAAATIRYANAAEDSAISAARFQVHTRNSADIVATLERNAARYTERSRDADLTLIERLEARNSAAAAMQRSNIFRDHARDHAANSAAYAEQATRNADIAVRQANNVVGIRTRLATLVIPVPDAMYSAEYDAWQRAAAAADRAVTAADRATSAMERARRTANDAARLAAFDNAAADADAANANANSANNMADSQPNRRRNLKGAANRKRSARIIIRRLINTNLTK